MHSCDALWQCTLAMNSGNKFRHLAGKRAERLSARPVRGRKDGPIRPWRGHNGVFRTILTRSTHAVGRLARRPGP